MKIKLFWTIILGTIALFSCTKNQENQTKVKNNEPSIKVIDTDFSKGRLTNEHTIFLSDVEKFHGHLCDGLVVGFLAIREGMKKLYPEGVVDRTNTRIVSKNAPCLSDVAMYISGGRYQYGTFYVDTTMKKGIYIIQRIDNGKTVRVGMKKGVKPAIIKELGKKAVKKELSPCQLDSLKILEDNFAEKLLSENPQKNFFVEEMDSLEWKPVLINNLVKTDIINKDIPKCDK